MTLLMKDAEPDTDPMAYKNASKRNAMTAAKLSRQ
jgi:hypothetical protein